MKSIYSFRSYRRYIEAFYLAKKTSEPLFSYRVFSKRAGFRADTYIWQVSSGKRNLSVDQIFDVALALELSESEILYFESLVHFEQAESKMARDVFAKRLVDLKECRSTQAEKLVSRKQRNVFYEDPFMPALLLCAAQKSRPQAESDLCSLFGLHVTEAKNVIDRFLENEFLRVMGNILEADWTCLSAKMKLTEKSGQNFLKAHLKIASVALEEQIDKQGVFYSSSLSLPASKLHECKEAVSDFLEKLSSQFDWHPSNEVFQANVQLYKITPGLLKEGFLKRVKDA